MSEHNNAAPLNSLEQALAAFTPGSARIDRDRLMFLAGSASTDDSSTVALNHSPLTRRHWLWPASTAVLGATSLALALALFVRPSLPPTIVFRDRPMDQPMAIAARQEESPEDQRFVTTTSNAPSSHIPSTGYLKTREVALRMGLDALGSAPYSAEPANPASYRDLFLGLTSSTSLSGSTDDQTVKQTTM